MTTAGGTSAATSADQYTYVDQPIVTGLDPSAGPLAGGNTVTINGGNFNGVTSVTFDGTSVSYTLVGEGQIVTTAPAHGAGTVNVVVVGSSGTSPIVPADRYTYYANPTISSLSPASGSTAGGAFVTVRGSGLGGITDVSIDGNSVDFNPVSDSALTFVAPSDSAGNVAVVVSNPVGSDSATFTYIAPPAPSPNVLPNNGQVPTPVFPAFPPTPAPNNNSGNHDSGNSNSGGVLGIALGLFNPNNEWSLVPNLQHPVQTTILWLIILALILLIAVPRWRRKWWPGAREV